MTSPAASKATKSPDPTPPKSNPYNGTPDWWMTYLVNKLLIRQSEFNERRRYFDGDHDEPQGDYRYMRALRYLRDMASTNYIGMITTTPVERMEIRGFRFGDPGTSDEDAANIWANSDMDLQSHSINMTAAIYGLSYALVTPAGENEDFPTITFEDPRTAITYPDPTRPTKSLAGLRMWEDEIVGRVLAVLYLPEGAYGYIGPPVYETMGLSLEDAKQRLLNRQPGAGGFTRAGFVPNPDGVQEVALTEFKWRPDTGAIPSGECSKDIRKIQDRINQTIFQQMCITHFQAYKQRWVTGLTLPKVKKKKGGNGRSLGFEPSESTLWAAPNENVKFGEFGEADITQVLESVRDAVGDIAALTKTPAHYLMGKMANISGETLTQAEAGLVSKTKTRMSSMGWSYQRVMKLCFAYMADKRAKDPTALVLWANPGRELIADTALAMLQWSQTGVPLEVSMEAAGNFTFDQIEFSVQYAKEQEAKQQAQATQQMQMQQDHQLQLAKTTASLKPGGGPSAAQGAAGPKSPAKPAAGATPKSATPTKPVKPAAKPK